MIHELKTWPDFFQEVFMGHKTFEVRKNDRDYKVGDTLILKEWELGGDGMTDNDLTGKYTGRELARGVSYVLHGGKFGIEPGYVVMGLS